MGNNDHKMLQKLSYLVQKKTYQQEEHCL